MNLIGELMVENIVWLGHDSFKITGEKIIYTDPFQIESQEEKADIVLITHSHSDHCSPEDIAKVIGIDTVIVCPPDCVGSLQILGAEIITVRPGDEKKVRGIPIKAVNAYNLNKFRSPGEPFHPKRNKWVGFVFEINGKNIYHTGDTDFIKEMSNVQCDIALLPVSGTFVMTHEEAAVAADELDPELAIPMHYGAIVGSREDAERFKEITSVNVEILEKTK